MDIDSGDVYDSAFIQNTVKRRLLLTNLYVKVDILPIVKNRKVDLYIVVKEFLYIGLAGTGYDYIAYRYGEPGNWWTGRFGLEMKNFRGRMETFKVTCRASGLEYLYPAKKYSDIAISKLSIKWLEWHSFGMGWSKPLFPSRYSIGMGFLYDHRPDELKSYDHSETAARLSVGRKFFERSQGSIGIIPDFRKHTSLPSSGIDTTADTTIFELFTSVGWSLDRRQKSFDPSKGWLLGLDMRSNFLYHGIDSGFVQFSLDVRYYQPIFLENHKLAFRIRSVARTHNGGELNRVMIGGEGSVRGYLPSQIGWTRKWTGNDAFLASGEYRFPLWYLPTMSIPEFGRSIFSVITGNDQYMSFRLDGALFADYGRVTRTFSDLITANDNPRHTGLGLGCGLRLLEVQKNIRLSFDIVWPDYLYTEKIDFSLGYWGYYLYVATYF